MTWTVFEARRLIELHLNMGICIIDFFWLYYSANRSLKMELLRYPVVVVVL